MHVRGEEPEHCAFQFDVCVGTKASQLRVRYGMRVSLLTFTAQTEFGRGVTPGMETWGKRRTRWRDGRQEAQEVEAGEEGAMRRRKWRQHRGRRRAERRTPRGGRSGRHEAEGAGTKRRGKWKRNRGGRSGSRKAVEIGAWQMRTEVAVAKGVVQDRPPARVGLEQLPAAAVVRVPLRVGKLEHPLSHHLGTHKTQQ